MSVDDEWIQLYQSIADRLEGIGSKEPDSGGGSSTAIRQDVFGFLERIRAKEKSRYESLIAFATSYRTMDDQNKSQSLSGLAAQLQ